MKKLDKLLYGDEIEWALRKDEMLHRAASPDGLVFKCTDIRNMTKEEKDVWWDIKYLQRNNFITPNTKGGYTITSDGKDFLTCGGFKTEAMRCKNEIHAFKISIFAIIISLISLVVTIFEIVTRH